MNKLDRWILGLIVSLGVLLPWATGAGVKLYLQAHGRPTLPWSYFLSPTSILFEIPLTLWLASPYLVLALVARVAFRDGHVPFVGAMSAHQRRAVVLVSLGVGSVATVAMFRVIFWEGENFDYFLTPLPVALPAVGIVVGWTLGLAAVFMAAQFSKLRHRHPPAASPE